MLVYLGHRSDIKTTFKVSQRITNNKSKDQRAEKLCTAEAAAYILFNPLSSIQKTS